MSKQTIDLSKKNLRLPQRTLDTLKTHFATNEAKMAILDAIASDLQEGERRAIDSLIYFCETNIESIYHLFMYGDDPLNPAELQDFMDKQPVGSCQKTLNRYMYESGRHSDDSVRHIDKTILLSQYFTPEVLQNFNAWIEDMNTSNEIENILAKCPNRIVLEFVETIGNIDLSSLAKIIMMDTLATSINELEVGQQIEAITLDEYKTIKGVRSTISEEEKALFQKNISVLSRDEKLLFNHIFIQNNDYDDDSIDGQDLTTRIQIILPLVKAIGKLGKDDSISLLLQAISTGQINLDNKDVEESIANLTKTQEEREEILA